MNGARLSEIDSMANAQRPVHSRRSEDDQGSEGELDEFISSHDDSSVAKARTRLLAAFIVFGLLNNVLYVVILSAALDLVPASTPKGVVALFNIFPALLAKVGWPYISSGKIRYGRRVLFCTACSWLGIVTIALSASVNPRLFGISLASLSSGLGELTFLQLSATLPSKATSRTAIGAWSTGTGAAGIVGAGLWWLLRGLGVKGGLGISSLLPLFFPITYFIILPPFRLFSTPAKGGYQPIPGGNMAAEEEAVAANSTITLSREDDDGQGRHGGKDHHHLTTADKIALVRPLLVRFMLPLFAVYVEEYWINSGVAPTLVFPLPTTGLWSRLFKSTRDYYPFWSLTYQTFVFISRSSLTLGLPPLPRRYLPLPPLTQLLILVTLSLQSSHFILSSPQYTPPAVPPTTGVDRTITCVFLLICLEGLCGGCTYVNAFYHVGRIGEQGGGSQGDEARNKAEREFRIGAAGAADSFGILFASLISMPTEVALCNAQIKAGRTLCRDL